MQILGEAQVKDFAKSKKSKLDKNLAKQIPLKILIAEDNSINQKLALKVFEKMGYNADIAANGLEVLSALRLRKYDVIFMDVQMPEMDGMEATKRVIETYKETRPYIIAMTANAMQGDREKCLAVGMEDYISKPIRFNEISSAIFKIGKEKIIQSSKPEETKISIKELMNWEIVDSIRDLDDGDEAGMLLLELANTFLKNYTKNRNDLKIYFDEKNAENLHQLSHKMKGASANLGAVGFSSICMEIEQLAKNEKFNNVENLMEQLDDVLVSTKKEFTEYLSKLGLTLEV